MQPKVTFPTQASTAPKSTELEPTRRVTRSAANKAATAAATASTTKQVRVQTLGLRRQSWGNPWDPPPPHALVGLPAMSNRGSATPLRDITKTRGGLLRPDIRIQYSMLTLIFSCVHFVGTNLKHACCMSLRSEFSGKCAFCNKESYRCCREQRLSYPVLQSTTKCPERVLPKIDLVHKSHDVRLQT